jgi:anti-sigma B factor antagonist
MMTVSQEPKIEVRSPQPHVALVVLAGEHDLYSADKVRQTFDQSLAVHDHLIVDLSAAEFIDSTIIAVLVQTMRSATDLERKFNVVLGTAPAVERILEITGLIPLLGVVPTVEQALAA